MGNLEEATNIWLERSVEVVREMDGDDGGDAHA